MPSAAFCSSSPSVTTVISSPPIRFRLIIPIILLALIRLSSTSIYMFLSYLLASCTYSATGLASRPSSSLTVILLLVIIFLLFYVLILSASSLSLRSLWFTPDLPTGGSRYSPNSFSAASGFSSLTSAIWLSASGRFSSP